MNQTNILDTILSLFYRDLNEVVTTYYMYVVSWSVSNLHCDGIKTLLWSMIVYNATTEMHFPENLWDTVSILNYRSYAIDEDIDVIP